MTTATANDDEVLRTAEGDFPLQEYRLRLDGRSWSILHLKALLSRAEEDDFVMEFKHRIPYGVALWPSAIAMAHEVASRGAEMRGRSVLELGAGTGLPGIVAASFGAGVVQTDGDALPMDVCRRNGRRNGAESIDYRLAQWAEWDDDARYDWIVGADILYGDTAHPHLRRIFDRNLVPGGRVLLADPFRTPGIRMLEAMEADGWRISLTKWTVGGDAAPRPIGVFELTPPHATA